MVQLTLAVCLRREDPVVNESELICFWIIVDAVNYTNAFNNAMYVTRILPSDQFDALTMLLVEYRIIKNEVAFRT